MSRVTVDHDVSKCLDASTAEDYQAHQDCFYVIWVVADTRDDSWFWRNNDKIEFAVAGQIKPHGSIVLTEHKPVVGEVKRNQYAFYRFHLGDN